MAFSRAEIIKIEDEWNDMVRSCADPHNVTFVNFRFDTRFVVEHDRSQGGLRVELYHVPGELDRIAWNDEVPPATRKNCRSWWKVGVSDVCQSGDLWKTITRLDVLHRTLK